LARDTAEFGGGDVDDLGVGDRFTQTHIDDNLLQLRNRHLIGVAEVLHQSRNDFLLVTDMKPARLLRAPRFVALGAFFRRSSLWRRALFFFFLFLTHCVLLRLLDSVSAL